MKRILVTGGAGFIGSNIVGMLADHTDLHPHVVFKRLKQQGGVFNYQRQSLAGLLAGRDQSLRLTLPPLATVFLRYEG